MGKPPPWLSWTPWPRRLWPSQTRVRVSRGAALGLPFLLCGLYLTSTFLSADNRADL